MKGAQPVGELIIQFLKSIGIYEKIEENLAIVYWESAVGEEIAANAKPLKVVKGILFVKVDDNVWRNELQYFKNEIMEKLNNKIGKKTISDIKFY